MYSTMMWLLIFQGDSSYSMGKKSAKPEAGWCKSLPRAAVPLEDVLHGQANGCPFLTHPLVPKASALRHSAEAWGGCCQQAARLTAHCCYICDLFSGVPLLPGPLSCTLAKPQNQFEGFPKAWLCPESQWRDGNVILSVPIHVWGTVPPPPDLVLVPHSFKNALSPRHIPGASICAKVQNGKFF